ncbi:hypothetical protein [Aliiruegeria lutimaris]|uniref:Uncharacterized protein n=1 Tax=Aliiruegeria lutimaris TaxID=571298 RepID=A0A1G8VR11_9RHOB|nr:hypothetical protein [Aliiruegeria lutimaris]SDJ68511.1 hypothetical protein SAMN04488026_10229 [Aliiruegeria lutimaris]
MSLDLIKDLQERNVVLSPSMKAEIIQAERTANAILSIMDGIALAANALTSAGKTLLKATPKPSES